MKYENFIKSSLEEVAKIARANFGKVEGSTKPEDHNQVLTETDIQVGKILVNKVKENYPDHNIIDEEAGVVDNNSKFTWVIDPIDGTSNFASGVPTYGILLGLLEGGIPIAGGMVLPESNELIVAEKGQGAFSNGERISVTSVTDLTKTLVVYNIDGHPEKPELTHSEAKVLGEIILNIRNLRTSGSCFDTAQVAKGAYGASLNQTSRIWDNVAVQIIIEEAGGVYTDFNGQPMDYSNPVSRTEQNYSYCCGAPEIHKELQEIIKNSKNGN